MLTGEPVPVSKRVGDKVIGATLNTNGALVMRSEHVGSSTMLAQIVQMVMQAQRSKAPMQRMADVVAGYFVVTVIAVAILSFLGWGLIGSGIWFDKCRVSADYCLPLCFRLGHPDVYYGGNR